MVQVKVKKLHPDAVIPTQQTAGSVGFDLHALEAGWLYSNEIIKVRTGIAIELPEGYFADVRPRSGLAVKHGVTVVFGTIDTDYRGEICPMLHCTGEPYFVTAGERIAQLVILQDSQAEMVEVDELTETERGEAGFGSTGKFGGDRAA